MTRKELAIEIYKMDEQKMPHKCTQKEWVKRALNGVGTVKGFLKNELLEMYNNRRNEKCY